MLPHESRLAAVAALTLFLTLFLPWYQMTLIAPAKAAKLESASATITGWGAFSFVEAAVLLVAAAVLTLLFQRAEGRAFHLPGGDGGVITAAGLWTCVLIVWRIFDKQGATTHGPSATSSGIEWGIFIALAAAAFLAYSGSRIRAAHRPEPPLPGEARALSGSSAAAPPDKPRRRAGSTELFERVVPDDPTTMRRARTVRPAGEDSPPPDEHPTDPFEDREHATLPLGDNATLPLGHDATLPLGHDATLPLGHDATLPLGEDATPPFGEDATLPLGEDATLPFGEDATLPLGDDGTLRLDDRPQRH